MSEKPPLQSRFTLLPSNFFPAKIPFYKIQKKNLAGKNLLCKRVIGIYKIPLNIRQHNWVQKSSRKFHTRCTHVHENFHTKDTIKKAVKNLNHKKITKLSLPNIWRRKRKIPTGSLNLRTCRNVIGNYRKT